MPILGALQAAAGAGIVHRDVKPANILLRENGTPVLADFGICHVEGGQRLTLSDRAMGSLNYIAPEMQAGQHNTVTSAVDVYALGKVLYWMVSGGHIFAREHHRAEGVYLVTRLRDQRWEHVHGLLDGMLQEDLLQRSSLVLLNVSLPNVEDMVNHGFMPLRPSLGLQCQWCGRGRYRTVARLQGDNVDWIGVGLRALKCDFCGHLELFQVQLTQAGNWLNQ
jgi:serine/threonine protein kinase